MSEEKEIKKKPKATLIKHKKPERSNESKEPDAAKEKKKVVVVKKKVVKVKKRPSKVVVKADETGVEGNVSPQKEQSPRPEETKAQTGSEPQNQKERRPESRPPRPREEGRRDTRGDRSGRSEGSGGSYEGNRNFRGDNRNYGDRPQGPGRYSGGRRDDNKPPFRKDRPPRQGGDNRGPRPNNRPATGRPPRQGGDSSFHGNRDFNKDRGGAPRGGNTGRGGPGRGPGPRRSASPPPPAAATEADKRKTSSRKFFKAKKKDTYTKKKYPEKSEQKIFQAKKKTINTTNPIPKEISIMEVITVSELARKMNLKAKPLIEKLMGMGMMVTINQQIDAETATLLAGEYGCAVNIVSLYDETLIEEVEDKEDDLTERPPIITVMGHVDHGKTKLLDAIRTTNMVDKEFGGITQHIGAYTVRVKDKAIVFLDTPGHEAFTLMRARGAQVTDIVVLVVAANDGVMPQTIEAINHAKEAGVPIIVAINKIDLVDANPDKVQQQLAEFNLIPEEWGGSTMYCKVSALKKEGISELLDAIILQTEIMELKANYDCRVSGKIIESKIDIGRGIVATVLVQKGTLRIGDAFVAGIFPGKVRAMFNDRGEKVDEVTPGFPAEIIGFTGVPNSGDPFQTTETEKVARNIGDKRQELKKLEDAQNVKKVTLDNLYDKIQEGGVDELKVIIKGDVHGSVEALKTALEKLSTPQIRLSVINALAGAINESDINMASASNALVIGFHVRPTPKAQALADREKVEIKKYNIIYDAIEDIRSAMEGLLAPVLTEEQIGTAEVRQTFKVPKIGIIAGCYVTEGKIRRNAEVHVIREGIDIYKGKISSLKRFKDDAKEVDSNFECGIGIENFNDLKEGDLIEAFEVKAVSQKLINTSDK